MAELSASFCTLNHNHQSELNNTGTDCCRNVVVLHHKDTLGRNLPAGIKVTLFDSAGKPHSALIEQNGISRHGVDTSTGAPQVRCGNVFWQLSRRTAREDKAKHKKREHVQRMEAKAAYALSEKDESFIQDPSDGYVLIEAEADGEVKKNAMPRFQLSHPLKIGAFWQNGHYECHIYATYLPPPMLLNLRFRQDKVNRLQNEAIDKMISQIESDGGVATLFIHGYNVPLGVTGRFPSFEDTVHQGVVSKNIPKPPYITSDYKNLFGEEAQEIQAPWLHYRREDLEKLRWEDNQVFQRKRTVHPLTQVPTMKEKREEFNGFGALSWFPLVEYYLNLAASGKDKLDDFVQWEKYSRIVGVTWSGSVNKGSRFFRAEMYANEAGRELARVLKKFIDAELKVNILTHSLGARVALSALNILGDFDGAYDEKISNLIMWEPAVADNAITNIEGYRKTKQTNPLAMEIFPFAHKAAEKITVLYSSEDGVVDGDKKWWDGEITGILGGAYPKKYNHFFSLFTRGTSLIEDDYYFGDEMKEVRRLQRRFAGGYVLNKGAERRTLRDAIYKEAKALNEDSEAISDKLTYLRPWSMFRRFDVNNPEHKEILDHITDIFIQLVENRWSVKNVDIRPPLGARGDWYTVQGKEARSDWSVNPKDVEEDKFISSSSVSLKNPNGKIAFFDQTTPEGKPYFLTHSAMRDSEYKKEFEDIYTYSYKQWIMNTIMDNSAFGKQYKAEYVK